MYTLSNCSEIVSKLSESVPASSPDATMEVTRFENTFGYFSMALERELPCWMELETPCNTSFSFGFLVCRSITDSARESESPALSIAPRLRVSMILSFSLMRRKIDSKSNCIKEFFSFISLTESICAFSFRTMSYTLKRSFASILASYGSLSPFRSALYR